MFVKIFQPRLYANWGGKKNYKSNHNENQDDTFSSMKRAIMIFSSKKKRDTKSMVGYDPTTMERFKSERIPSC
jgi:hypothetical protein